MTTATEIPPRQRRIARNYALHEEFINDTYPMVRQLELPRIPERSDRVAVIIEPREHPYLEYVLRNTMYFLGPSWGLQIVCGKQNYEFVRDLVTDWGVVRINVLDVDNLTREEFRDLRKNSKFWAGLAGDMLLCFETDTLLRRPGVEPFLDYDYVGAPWNRKQAVSDVVRVGNGGLSLRRRRTMIDMCLRGKTHAIPSEDTYFSIQLHLHRDELNLPSVEVARQFAVESLYYPDPVGLHKPWNYLRYSEMLTLYEGIRYDQDSAPPAGNNDQTKGY